MQTVLDIHLERYQQVRKATVAICSPLLPEDCVVQPTADVSPPKWHLGHTTWFFETFILKAFLPDYQEFHKDFSFVFNSYYESVGTRIIRTNRGNLSRPATQEIYAYREYVDKAMARLLVSCDLPEKLMQFLEIGLQHEQQHQELLYSDIKYILGTNPLFPVYQQRKQEKNELKPVEWWAIGEGLYTIGYHGDSFCWDNEKGVHQVYLESFEARKSLVTNGEYLTFMNAGGYDSFQYWLSEGWEWAKSQESKAPLYWYQVDGEWHHYTLSEGLVPLDLNAPVTHISFFEADAFANWSGHRLLTEFEWEALAKKYGAITKSNNFVGSANLQPQTKLQNNQLFGDCWEWTNSAYLPYPRYEKAEGALGEYNGKFMINQMVLRGGSCITPSTHIRVSYRNFFHTAARWQFTGIRLAKSSHSKS